MIIRDEYYRAEVKKYFPNIDIDNEMSQQTFFSLKRVISMKHALENEALNKQYIINAGLVEGIAVTNGEITTTITTVASNGRLGLKGQRGSFKARDWTKVK